MLCERVRKQSRSIWKTLHTAHALGCSVGEESITDYLILELAKGASSGGYSVQAFTKFQESLNGADWELWLTGTSKTWFGFRIQSKKIRASTLNYPHLHPAPGAGLQTQAHKLVAAAGLVGAVPIYALYSAWPNTAGAPTWNCGTYALDKRLWGMAAVPALTVAMLAPANGLAAISPHMIPFQCLICCPAFGGSDLPTRVHAFARDRSSQQSRLLDSPPAHVLRLLERDGQARSGGNEPDLPLALSRVIVVRQAAAG